MAPRARPPARRCGTPPSWPAAPRSWATTGSGWPSTTTCRRSPAPRPAVLLAHLAAATSTIRVGSGGVMLPNHAPLVVAEQFGTLEALHPGRIDLGIGRAPGHRPGDRAGAAPHHGGAVGRGLPAGAGRPDGLLQRRATPGPIIATPGRGEHAGGVAARLERVQRAARRAARAAVLLRAPLQRGRTRCRRCRCTGRASGRRSGWTRPYAMVGGQRGLRRDRRAGASGWPGRRAVVPEAALGPPGAAGRRPEEAAAYPYTRAGAASSSRQRREGQAMGSPETVRPAAERAAGAHRRGRADAHHDGVRRGRPGALVRADRRAGGRRAAPATAETRSSQRRHPAVAEHP